jgi:phosphatidate cytidylyltransferase
LAAAGRNFEGQAVSIVSNLLTRIIAALFGIPLLVWPAWEGGIPLYALVIALQIAMLIEWRQLLLHHGVQSSLFTFLIAFAAFDFFALAPSGKLWPGLAVAIAVLWMTIHVFRNAKSRIAEMGATVLFLTYIALPLALWLSLHDFRLHERYSSAGPLLLLFVATWFCDSGAYFIGRAFGKHKLFVRASPNKTIEGAVGGFLFAAVPLFFVRALGLAEPSLIDFIMLPIAVGVFGQLGDLLESLFKREFGVKDSSHFIPGHGGVLDRFDSLLLSTPVFYSFLLITS